MRIDSRRLAAAALAALLGLGSSSCETATSLIPNTAGVFVVLRDSSLGFQNSATATRQYSIWRADGMKISIAGQPDYSFLPNGACSIAASGVSDGSPVGTCGGSALTLQTTDSANPVIVRLDLAGMETISARRPSLPDDQDYDGDGVNNKSDNCKLVPNPGQEVFGEPAAGKPGIACAAIDGAGDPTIPDQDNDGVRDSADNCLWYPNPLLPGDISQTDVNRNGIGDLCEVAAPITFAGTGRLSLACPGSVRISDGTRSTFVVDFTEALTCDVDYAVCSLDVTKITMRLSSELISPGEACADVSAEPSR